jgi:ketosteroid isomerase-like protein
MCVGDTQLVAGSGEEIVRSVVDVINGSESVDAVMAALDGLMHPEIQYVNPKDAIEGGTRTGVAGMRTVFENFIAGAGGGATIELEQVEERGDRVFGRSRVHARGTSSGAEAVGPPTAVICTIRDGRILRIEWHYDVAKARARFEQDG